MKRSILLIVAMLFFVAGEIFADTIVAQETADVCGYVKGSTTLKLSGTLNEAAMEALSKGESVSVQSSFTNYLCAPMLLDKTKKGFGKKSKVQIINASSKNGKFSWTEKDVTKNLAFAIGSETIEPTKATLKSSGTLLTECLPEFETREVTIFDILRNEGSEESVGAYAFTPEKKGENYKYSAKEKDIQVKFSADSKGKANLSYKLSPAAVSPALCEDKYADCKMYLVIDLLSETNVVSYLDDMPEGGWTDEYKTTKIVMRFIRPGSFTMGSPKSEKGRYDDEVQHNVTLTKGYYIGVFEITQRQYELITGNNPSKFKGDMRPVDQVSYDMLRGKFLGMKWPLDNEVDDDSVLKILRSKTDLDFDLPTEAQWEYACRAGTTTGLNNGTDISKPQGWDDSDENLDKLGRYRANESDGKGGYSEGYTTVGSYLPNAWGLYDMHGNVSEWCLDWYGEYNGDAVDPRGAVNITNIAHDTYYTYANGLRIARGGEVDNLGSPRECRSAVRGVESPDEIFSSEHIGFRLALTLEDKKEEKIIKKDFEYELKSETGNTLPVFSVKFYGKLKDGREELLSNIGTLSGEGATGIVLGNGKHTISWIPQKDYADIINEIEMRVEYVDVTSEATYLVLDLNSNMMRASMNAPNVRNDKCRTDELWLRRIEPGTFIMGSPTNELGRSSYETQHEVTLTKAYYIGVFEMTQSQFKFIAGYNPSVYLGDKGEKDTCPVSGISYNAIRGGKKGAACPWNNEVDDNYFLGIFRAKTGLDFDLPTEAQWEYACRAGTTTAWNNGTDILDEKVDPNLSSLGRYRGNMNDGKPGYYGFSKVGLYSPNAWGLYDMHGNASEWCRDHFSYDDYVRWSVDPVGSFGGIYRVIRGGDCCLDAHYCRSAWRDDYKPESSYLTGFRLVLTFFEKEDKKIRPGHTFEYTLDSDSENTLPVFSVVLYGYAADGTKYLLENIGDLEYDGSAGMVVGKGPHKVNWYPDDDHIDLVDDLELRVQFEDVTSKAAYLVLDLSSNKISASADAPDVNDDKCRKDELWLRRIEPGKFTMGSPTNELGRSSNESQHEVILTKAFYIGVFEITQKQLETIFGDNHSYYLGDDRPAENISYNIIRGFDKGAAWPASNHNVDEGSFLGKLRKIAGNVFDLPTEAQWEYACRAGTTTAWNNGTDITSTGKDPELDKLGRYGRNTYDGKGGYYQHAKVGSYLPNAWGLYDMHGNVNEFCLDWYSWEYPEQFKDPSGPNFGESRCLRGGAWYLYSSYWYYDRAASYCRAAARSSSDPTSASDHSGFRVVIVQ